MAGDFETRWEFPIYRDEVGVTDPVGTDAAIDAHVAEFVQNTAGSSSLQESLALINTSLELAAVRHAQATQTRNFLYAAAYNIDHAIQSQDRELTALRTMVACSERTRERLTRDLEATGQGELDVSAEEDDSDDDVEIVGDASGVGERDEKDNDDDSEFVYEERASSPTDDGVPIDL